MRPQPHSNHLLGELLPLSIGGAPLQEAVGDAQGAAQLVDILDPLVEHQLAPLDLMDAQELEEALLALFAVTKQRRGEVAVEELHAAADGARLAQLREVSGEGTEIDLQQPLLFVTAPLHQMLLEAQELVRLHPVVLHVLQMEAQVAPARHPRAHRDVDPRGAHHRLLGGADQTLHHAAGEGAPLVALAEPGEGVPQIGAQQQRLLPAGEGVEQLVEPLGVALGEAVEFVVHGGSWRMDG